MRKLIFAIAMMLATPAISADYLDTQFGPDGIDVHLLKASVANNVLTIAFMLENTSNNKLKIASLAIDEALYTTKDTKYPVLKDANDKYLASTITYDDGSISGFIFAHIPDKYITFTLKSGGKSVGWVKFEAPSEADWPIEVSLPGVTPFTIENPAK